MRGLRSTLAGDKVTPHQEVSTSRKKRREAVLIEAPACQEQGKREKESCTLFTHQPVSPTRAGKLCISQYPGVADTDEVSSPWHPPLPHIPVGFHYKAS